MKIKKLAFGLTLLAGLSLSACTNNDLDAIDVPQTNGNLIENTIGLSTIELTENAESAITGANDFSYRFFKTAFKENPENMTVSPYSAYITLSLLANGDNGEGRDAILNMISGKMQEADLNNINELNKILLTGLPAVDKITDVIISNSVWFAPKETNLNTDFAENISLNYGAELLAISPCGEEGMCAINSWVEKNTIGKIVNFLDKPLDSYIALANTLYLKTPWTYKFDKSKTSSAIFHNINGDETIADMMSCNGIMFMCDNNNFSAIRMDCGNGNYSLTAIMPRNNDDFHQICGNLTPEFIESLNKNMILGRVDLKFPKINREIKTDIIPILTRLYPGINLIEFHDMAEIPFVLTEAIHGTNMTIDEDGIEGASATVLGMVMSNGSETKPVEMNFNKPFVYIIKENSTGIVLFAGTVTGF